ncbi:hypothetical protein BDB01DRAFT_855602 [Pilobolus umbonatus]|nr:hypothetical protein BDB01DRAFT_855602 [Pilobolus umbonatus]
MKTLLNNITSSSKKKPVKDSSIPAMDEGLIKLNKPARVLKTSKAPVQPLHPKLEKKKAVVIEISSGDDSEVDSKVKASSSDSTKHNYKSRTGNSRVSDIKPIMKLATDSSLIESSVSLSSKKTNSVSNGLTLSISQHTTDNEETLAPLGREIDIQKRKSFEPDTRAHIKRKGVIYYSIPKGQNTQSINNPSLFYQDKKETMDIECESPGTSHENVMCDMNIPEDTFYELEDSDYEYLRATTPASNASNDISDYYSAGTNGEGGLDSDGYTGVKAFFVEANGGFTSDKPSDDKEDSDISMTDVIIERDTLITMDSPVSDTRLNGMSNPASKEVDTQTVINQVKNEEDKDTENIIETMEKAVASTNDEPIIVNHMDDSPFLICSRSTGNEFIDIMSYNDPISTSHSTSTASTVKDEKKKEKKVVSQVRTRSTRSSSKRLKKKSKEEGGELSKRRFLKTGYVYDIFMSYHATPDPTEIHPEDPRRIFKIYRMMKIKGLFAECERIKSRRATREEILLVHNIPHYKTLRDSADFKKRSDYMNMEKNFNSVYLNSMSFESGLFAVGSLIELVEAVVKDTVKNAFAIIRPPGHHAEVDVPMGFCLFNNVAIATKDSMKRLNVKRTLILDWDVHFGNGTQSIFSDDPNVLYISLHRYEDCSFYPSDRKGALEYVGHGDGVGRTVNIPWPCSGMTDADYVYAFRQVVMPVAEEFNPELVIVSAGFDAAVNDPIGKCKVTPAGYSQMTYMLKSLALGKMVIALEGGYDLNSIAVSAVACMNVLLGESPESIDEDLLPKKECIDTVELVKKEQVKYWNCFKNQ